MTTTALRFTGDHAPWQVLLVALALTSLGNLAGCNSTSPSPPVSDSRPPERSQSHKQTTLNLTNAQLEEFDATGTFTPTPEQSALLIKESGAAPSSFRMRYDVPDGEALFAYNLAIRTGSMTVSIPHRYIFTDHELIAKKRFNQWFGDGYQPPKKDYPSYLIDHKGRVWKHLSQEEWHADLARGRKEIGAISVSTPTSQLNKDTFASEDTIRQFQQRCVQSGLNRPYLVTAPPQLPAHLPPKSKSR